MARRRGLAADPHDRALSARAPEGPPLERGMPQGAPTFSKNLAIFGTASDVGKSTMAAAFGRLLTAQGLRVAPYKAQNMSNNAFVTRDGGEIGRAQYVQAVACRVEPSVHHNPVLLKPQADDLSQVILHGQALSRVRACDYFANTAALKAAAHSSLEQLQQSADVIVLEGAGSCAEVNLRSREFVNFPAAHAAKASVILVADIDKGGVFAQVVGSLEVMPEEDRQRVRGILINKFRGDIALFRDGVEYLEARTGLPVLGVVPYVYGLALEAEDALPLHAKFGRETDETGLRIAVVYLPHISNFTDFDALSRRQGVSVRYVRHDCDLQAYDAVILPGSKAVVSDLQWLRRCGLAEAIVSYSRGGGKLIGVCGGYQMLGTRIVDPTGLESSEVVSEGLGLLQAETQFEAPKVVRQVSGTLRGEPIAFNGYQIHYGKVRAAEHEPLLLLDVHGERVPEGVRADSLGIWASTVHGLFDEPEMATALLRWLGAEGTALQAGQSQREWLDLELTRIAEHVRAHVDFARVLSWLA
jgi:adenosylcobyric acid synthase